VIIDELAEARIAEVEAHGKSLMTRLKQAESERDQRQWKQEYAAGAAACMFGLLEAVLAELAAMRAALTEIAEGEGETGSHWEGCEEAHHDCCLVKLRRAEAALFTICSDTDCEWQAKYEQAEADLAALKADSRNFWKLDAEKARDELATLKALATSLCDRMEVVHNDRRYFAVWQNAQNHMGKYEGPTYTDELGALQDAVGWTAREEA
jgi:hypothetical protein